MYIYTAPSLCSENGYMYVTFYVLWFLICSVFCCRPYTTVKTIISQQELVIKHLRWNNLDQNFVFINTFNFFFTINNNLCQQANLILVTILILIL